MSGSKGTVIRALSGNSIIAGLKLTAWAVSGSGAMLSEGIHSLADTGNQALLLLGLQQAEKGPDERHQFGYGQAAFFWALVSALGIFFLGCGATLYHGISTVLHPPERLDVGWLTWSVLGLSFAIDGWVLASAVQSVLADRPAGKRLLRHVGDLKDPMLLAVLLEDLAACTGVLLAIGGILAAEMTGNTIWDGVASILIGLLLGLVALVLVRMNQRYLLGHAVDPEIEQGIRHILLSRPSVESVAQVRSRWVGPSTFVYKAEVDFDGRWFAGQLAEGYSHLFEHTDDHEAMLRLLAVYTEHVSRLVANEVDVVEGLIRTRYPQAAFIVLEPDG